MDGLKSLLPILAVSLLGISCQKSGNSDPASMIITRASQVSESGKFSSQEVASSSITISRLEMRTRGGKAAFVLDTEKILNLLELRDDLAGVLKDLSIPAGDYDLIRLYITEASIDLKDGRHFPMTVPSGAQSGLKVFVSPAIIVSPEVKTNLTFAFDLERSFKPQSSDNGQGISGFNFRPVVRATNLQIHGGGLLHGIVLDNDQVPVADAIVTILNGTDIVATTITDADGTYKVIALPEGTYTVAVVKDDFQAAENTEVQIVSTSDTEIKFELSDVSEEDYQIALHGNQ